MKRFCLISGLLILGLIWTGPLLTDWRASFSAHMLAHMGVVAFAAPLIAVGLAGTRADFTRGNALLASPLLASLVDLVVVWLWHAPTLRALVQTSTFAGVIEQASFLVAGVLLWLSCLGYSQSDRSVRRLGGAAGLLFTSIHMTLLGALLTLSPRPLYGEGEVTCFGTVLSAGRDQELGGVMMLLIGAAVYLAGGVALLGGVLQQREARQ